MSALPSVLRVLAASFFLVSGVAAAATSFQQIQTTPVGIFSVYAWSSTANWTSGVPVNGSQVAFNILGGGNPSGYDDIANLYLDQLTLTNGYVGVAGTLSIGTVSFGASSPSLYSDTFLSGTPASLIVGVMSGGQGEIGAFGPNSLTTVLSATDPGEIYQVDDDGELVLTATPNATSGFYYQNSVAKGTFAFQSPGATVGSVLAGVAIGDSIALPGSSVFAVTYGASSLTISTNLGTTTFNNVFYSGVKPTGYTVSTDPTGLVRITFVAAQATSFQQSMTTPVGIFSVYAWSSTANWTSGVPVNGSQVAFNILGGGNPSGYDDIANLYLDQLTLTNGYVGVAGTLSIGTVSFGASSPSLYSDTFLSGTPASLIVGVMSGGQGEIGAFGPNSLTTVLSATDPGEIYQVDDDGELVLTATPNATSGFYYQNSVAKGTFAFQSPGATVGSVLAGVAIGDSIALPGSSVFAVTYGASSLTISTNLGTTTFNNVFYSGVKPTAYIVAAYPTGLVRVTFASASDLIFANGFE